MSEMQKLFYSDTSSSHWYAQNLLKGTEANKGKSTFLEDVVVQLSCGIKKTQKKSKIPLELVRGKEQKAGGPEFS